MATDPTDDELPPPDDPEPEGHASELAEFLGRELGEYRLVRFLGAGGMGQVYEARRAGWRIRYAVKILHPRQDAREIEIQQHFQHPHIVAIHDAGEFVDARGRTRRYLVMQLVEGARSITRYAEDMALPLPDRVRLVLDVCDALGSAIHDKGGRHFDIKPDNLLVDDRGFVRIADMGLSRLATDLDLQRVGGTKTYKAYEQFEAGAADLDQRADVYAIGAVLHELATGAPPHPIPSGCSHAEALARKRRDPPGQLRVEHPELDAIVRPTLVADPGRRTPSIDQVRRELAAWLERRVSLLARARRSVRAAWRRPLVRATGLTASGSALAALIGGIISVLIWPMANWESIAPAPVVDEFRHVRMVAVPSGAEVEALASDLSIQGVSATRPVTWRALHARLCERLGGVADAIVFDFHFRSQHDSDKPFAAAIQRCQSREGTPVVVAVPRHSIDAGGKPTLSPALWQAGVHWGHWHVFFTGPMPWIPLLADSGDLAIPSLALEAAMVSRIDGAYAEHDLRRERIHVRYWRASPNRPGGREYLHARDVVTPTSVVPVNEQSHVALRTGFRTGDRMAHQRVDPPPAPARSEATVSLRDVLLDDGIRDGLRNKIVLVFDAVRDPKERFEGEMMSIAYVHGVAIEALRSHRRHTSRWSDWPQLPLMLIAGATGAWVGVFATRASGLPVLGLRSRPATRGILIALAGSIVVGLLIFVLNEAALWLADERLILLNPVPSACALSVGALVGVLAPALGMRVDRPRTIAEVPDRGG